jgi:dipeptidyl aminopeptidase/acylaminoacyl peptidase
LQVPVLVAHGEEDTTVPFKQSKWMADALARAGKPFEFHAYPGEGHGFDKSKNLADWLDRLEAFLARYNPVAP